jgi:hypothetical protein
MKPTYEPRKPLTAAGGVMLQNLEFVEPRRLFSESATLYCPLSESAPASE